MAKAHNWKGVPKQYRKDVRKLMALKVATMYDTPQKTYRELLRMRAYGKAQAEKAIREQKAKQAREQKAQREEDRETVKKSMSTVAEMGDFCLERLANGDGFGTLDVHSYAQMIRATLCEAMREMEKALFRLGVYEGANAWEWGVEGYFESPLRDKVREEWAAARRKDQA